MFDKDAEYEISVNYTDVAGNAADEKTSHFIIDTVNPDVDITYNNTDIKNTVDGVDYLGSAVTATIKITEDTGIGIRRLLK